MQTQQFELKKAPPSAEQFAQLRQLIGWTNPDKEILIQSMDNSLFWVTAVHGEKLLGVGRVVGDGHMYFYIQDVIVHPDFQEQGIGTSLMITINDYLTRTCKQGATVGLLAALGKETFYRKFGFIERNGQGLGLGMCKFI